MAAATVDQRGGLQLAFEARLIALVEHALDAARDHAAIKAELAWHCPPPPNGKFHPNCRYLKIGERRINHASEAFRPLEAAIHRMYHADRAGRPCRCVQPLRNC